MYKTGDLEFGNLYDGSGSKGAFLHIHYDRWTIGGLPEVRALIAELQEIEKKFEANP